MLSREECEKALDNLKVPTDDWESEELQLAENNITEIEYKEQESIDVLESLIKQHFSNPPLEWEERVKFLEKQLDIAIKELCFRAKGADACNSLDNLYEGVKEWIEEQARKEVQE